MIKILKMISGELLIVTVDGIDDEGNMFLKYPAAIVPIQQNEQGQAQIGFTKVLPFSDYSEDLVLNPQTISISSIPMSNIKKGYEQWVKQLRQQESGIIIPEMNVQ